MPRAALLRSIWTPFTRFIPDEQGNIAVIFAIALVPVLSLIGTAIDYSRAVAARASMQAALDSAALMVAKDLSSGIITTDQIDAKGQSYFNGLFTNKEALNVAVKASYTPASGNNTATIKMSGSGSIKSHFMGIAGFPTIDFDAGSTSTWGASLLRVALVLDNTGSMNGSNKIGALKTAAKNLVDQLSTLAQHTGDVMISVIPFEMDVNVGTSNVDEGWLRWDLWDSKKNNCSGGSSWTMAQCVGRGYTWNHTPKLNKSKWNGCVTDRDQSYDITADPPTSTSTYFIADQDENCPVVPIKPLSTDWTGIKNAINSMVAQGSTNQTIGLQWGWLSLMQQAPMYAPSESSTNAYQHVIILFTDGLNTADRWYGDGSKTSSQVDSRMKALCDNIKAAKDPKTGKAMYTIYTVQIDTDGAGQSAVLPYCASNTSNFYMLTQPSEIATAFASIGTSISKLRVAR